MNITKHMTKCVCTRRELKIKKYNNIQKVNDDVDKVVDDVVDDIIFMMIWFVVKYLIHKKTQDVMKNCIVNKKRST